MTGPLGPPTVEPLPDAAWNRVERGLWNHMDRESAVSRPQPRRPRLWLAVPVLAAAALALWLGFRSHDTQPIDDEPTRIVAGATPSSASFGDAHVELDANTALDMFHQGRSPSAMVEYGAAWFSVAPRGVRPPFEVRAGDAIVRVIGTRFRVARDAEHVDVLVDHGIVEVRFRGALVTLTANQSWSSAKPTEIATSETHASIDPAPAMKQPDVVAPPASTPPPPPTLTPNRVDIERARYETLQRLEAKRPDAAMTGYLELSKGSSKWAPIALFAAARLAVDRHDRRAKSLLTIYLNRFQQGANADDARQLLRRLDEGTP
ncbi:MAG: FecR family protein [Polyangiaceae bacterium]